MVDITLTDANPSHFAQGGGGPQAATVTEANPTYFAQGGGGPAVIELTDLPPILPTPLVTTDPATGIGQVSATLNGTLDDDGGFPCECWFEWGLDTTYGTLTPPETKSIGESFSFELHGLVPGTTYHFRAVARNVFGISHGADMEFTTDIQINRAHALSREEL